jgi:Zn-dependent protease
MFRWKIARVMGINLYVNWTFLLLPLFVIMSTWERGAPLSSQGQAMAGVVLIVATMVCVILHELGHAWMARQFGIRTLDINISVIGGVARLERMSEKPWAEFLIAIAGPAVNAVITFSLALLLVPLAILVGDHLWDFPVSRFFLFLLMVNGGLVLFNMLPAFPMDGGRVLRSVLCMFMNRLRATEIAVYVGMFVAGLVVVVGVVYTLFAFMSAILLLSIMIFIIGAGLQELAMVRHRYAMLHEQPIDVIAAGRPDPAADVHVVDPGFSGLAWDVSRRAWVIWRDGRPISSYGAKPE